jgi:1,2-dihydroxy-3-keto-5-methylthiopentene dioxygenase
MKAFYLDNQELISAASLLAQDVWTAHWPSDDNHPTTAQALAQLRQQGGYTTKDIIELTPHTPNLEGVMKKFDGEHCHSEDEVRFVLAGSGVFDIRDRGDRMMRVVVEEGDAIVVPQGRYHRFELTASRHIRCVRLFQNQAGWVPDYRSASAS